MIGKMFRRNFRSKSSNVEVERAIVEQPTSKLGETPAVAAGTAVGLKHLNVARTTRTKIKYQVK